MRKDVSRPLLKSIVAPVLSSGLQALCLRIQHTKRLQRSQNLVLRRTYMVGKIAPTSPLLLMLSILPMEGGIHYQLLSLFNNIANLPGPAKTLLIFLFETPHLKRYHWSKYLRDICAQYSLPDPGTIIKMPNVNKQHWKEIIRPRILEFHDRRLKQKINRGSL